jgi:membrane associated rhomboid family serine protease
VLLTDGSPAGVATGEYYRLVTAAFLHAGPLHLLLNMFALASLGPQLESALGRLRFGALYGLSALGGSVLAFCLTAQSSEQVTWLLSSPRTLSVGASGAIFGLFGAYYVVVRRLGGPTGSILALLAVNLVITFAVPFIDWRAHLGGLVTGTLLAAAFAYAPRGPRRGRVQAAACGATAALILLALVLRRAALTG